MPLTSPKAANPADIVGRTPWSARDALVPEQCQAQAGRRGRRTAVQGDRPTIHAGVW